VPVYIFFTFYEVKIKTNDIVIQLVVL